MPCKINLTSANSRKTGWNHKLHYIIFITWWSALIYTIIMKVYMMSHMNETRSLDKNTLKYLININITFMSSVERIWCDG